MFKNMAQAREAAAYIMKDMPIETIKTAVRRMNTDHFNDQEAYSSFVEWVLDALEWRIEWDALMHAGEMAEMKRAREKAQEFIDELTQEDVDI